MSHRVLIVDDEESIQQLLSDYFTECGYEVSCAGDGEEAIRQFNVSPPDIAVIDYLLPKKNGFDVARAVRANPLVAKRPLILMSGVFKNPKTAIEAREEYGALAFLDKPLDLAALEQLVANALAQGGARSPDNDSGELDLALSLDDSDDLSLDQEALGSFSHMDDSVTGDGDRTDDLVKDRPFPDLPPKGDHSLR